jgi:hypothetical protein
VYGIHNNHDHIDEGDRVKGDRRWEKGEGWKNGKMRETGDKGKKESRERERRREVGEDYPLSSPS